MLLLNCNSLSPYSAHLYGTVARIPPNSQSDLIWNLEQLSCSVGEDVGFILT
jgi:hypothetical protein